MTHVTETLAHELLHDALAAVFRIGTDTGDKAYRVDRTVDIHFQGIDSHLGDKGLVIKTAQNVCALQNGELGLFDLVVAPATG